MKALVVRQPWAWGIASGQKRIENRSWSTKHRGELLVVAGSSRASLNDDRGLIKDLPSVDLLPFGFAVAIVNVIDCVPLEECRGDPFAEGPWCWLLDDARKLAEPFPVKGRLGVFDVPFDRGGRVGIEPPSPAWRSGMLPLHYGGD